MIWQSLKISELFICSSQKDNAFCHFPIICVLEKTRSTEAGSNSLSYVITSLLGTKTYIHAKHQ